MKKPDDVHPFTPDRNAAFLIWDVMIQRGWFPSCGVPDFLRNWQAFDRKDELKRFIGGWQSAIACAKSFAEGRFFGGVGCLRGGSGFFAIRTASASLDGTTEGIRLSKRNSP